ncbi:COQ9 family protein [Hyphobacterium sp.]|uniref:COQ9 family protein n=1 Tax=Hyphobacterium sp. TaxID=2004662 RepID=UPI003BAAD514
MRIDAAAVLLYIGGMMSKDTPTDLDLLLDAALVHAAYEGWSDAMLREAAEDAGVSEEATLLAAPRGVLDVIAHWSLRLDEAMLARMEAADLASMKIRDRVTLGVQARLEAIGRHEEAARRARARLMLHDAGSLGPELIWATSDKIWRALKDPSTDFNWYSKRTILSAVYTSSLAAWLNDENPDKAKAKAFLDRRIQNVMEFEKAKAGFQKMTKDWPDPAEVLAGLRYGRSRR